MQATVLIVHRGDTLLRAIVRLLASEGYRVRSGDTIAALQAELTSPAGPTVLVVDADAAGSAWLEQLGPVAAATPVVALTWESGAAFPDGVTPLRKPFSARELLEALSRRAAARGTGGPEAAR